MLYVTPMLHSSRNLPIPFWCKMKGNGLEIQTSRKLVGFDDPSKRASRTESFQPLLVSEFQSSTIEIQNCL